LTRSQQRTPAGRTPPTSSSPDRTTAWAKAVVTGKVVAGPHVRNAARRHLDDRKHERERGLRWDAAAAARAFRFFEGVLHLAGGKFEGKKFTLHPSQAFIVGSIFGWKHRETKLRRFRRAYIEQGKGNGKSPLAAGIGMYCLLADDEPRAEVYAAAAKKDQAMVLFRDAVAMRNQSPKIAERVTPSGGNPVWNLADLSTGSFFRPIASDDSQSGPRPSCALCDEVHEHRDGNVIEMLERGFKAREQPLLVMITNSGSDLNSVCWEEHVNAIRASAGNPALGGRIDETTDYLGDPDAAATYDDTFSFVCSLDAKDDPLTDPNCWVKANPLLGVTQPVSELERAVRQAKAMPGKLNNILRLHFCVWTQSDKAWIARETLEAVLADFDPAEFEGETVYLGADLSGSQDLTALAFMTQTGFVDMPADDGGKVRKPTFALWVDAWTPGDTIAERASRDKAPYEVWRDRGFLNAPPGRQIRLDYVAARIARATSEYRVAWLAYDRYAYAKLADELDAAGVTVPQVEHAQGGKRRGKPPEEVVEAAKFDDTEPQGLWMPASLGMLETLILEKRIAIHRNPVLISAMMSAAIEEDAFGNRWLSKRKATNRIDAAVASAMAVGVATAEWGAADGGGSIWDRSDLVPLLTAN
jgi:phage terminase large subunit-like protein